MDLEKLIELVREHELLYNFNHKNYHDAQKKEMIWRVIGKKINQSGKECKKQWNSLRDNYRRSMKKRKLADSSVPYAKKWKFEDEMNFILPFMKERPIPQSQDPALSSDEEMDPIMDVDESLSSENKNVCTTTFLAETSSVSEAMIKFLLDNKKDEIETLFYSLAQTVKKMNSYYQALAKARVCSIISELELQYLTEVRNPQSANVPTPVSSPQSSSSQAVHTELVDVKPF